MIAFVLAGAPGAVAHDSASPPGAPHRWLPHEEWVWRHWVPFDEHTLTAELGLKAGQLEAYLLNDHRTLAQLAARRGIGLNALVERLLVPWRHADGPQRALLRDRTRRLLTQGHLAQHVFFHVFHGDYVTRVADSLFGLSRDAYWELRWTGATPSQIAARSGVSSETVKRGLGALFEQDRQLGLRAGVTTVAQADRIIRRQRHRLECWLQRPEPPQDWGNPYGHGAWLHGVHGPGWPATAAERRLDDRRVERARRSLRRSCWGRPRAWHAAARATTLRPRPVVRSSADAFCVLAD